jgi:hypothetical protein
VRQVTVQNGKYSARADHRRHDRLLVTRYAMDDSYPGERDQARQLTDACADCAELAADVRVIAASMAQLPAPIRQRDFTISQEQADQLRGSRLAQLLRGLAAPGWATLRPVAGVALSIGLVMAVVGSVLPTPSPGAITEGGAPGSQMQTFGGAQEGARPPGEPEPVSGTSAPRVPSLEAPQVAAPDIARPGDEPGAQPLAQATQDTTTRSLDTAYLEEESPEIASNAGDGDGNDMLAITEAPADPTRNLLLYAGLAIMLISLALLVLAWSARRYFADPLLR